jgi:hypothetical protein
VRPCGELVLLLAPGETLVYGSDDQGGAVHVDDPVMNGMVRSACTALNLTAHNSGRNRMTLVWGCCDIEGHRITSVTGEKSYYLLDVARLLPPVSQKHLPWQPMHTVTYDSALHVVARTKLGLLWAGRGGASTVLIMCASNATCSDALRVLPVMVGYSGTRTVPVVACLVLLVPVLLLQSLVC